MLRKTYQRTERKGTESFPITMRSLWRLVKESVLTENCRVKEQLKEAIRILEGVQDKESLPSCKGDPEGEELKEPEEAQISDSSGAESSLSTGSILLPQPRKKNPFCKATAPPISEREVEELWIH